MKFTIYHYNFNTYWSFKAPLCAKPSFMMRHMYRKLHISASFTLNSKYSSTMLHSINLMIKLKQSKDCEYPSIGTRGHLMSG